MASSSASRLGAATLALAAAASLGAGCGKDAAPPKRQADAGPSGTPWVSKATDNVVLAWRARCGTDAKAKRLGPSIQINFMSDTADTHTVCSLQYREATRDMVSASVLLTAGAPPATLYGLRVQVDKLVRELVVPLLPDSSQAALTAALDSKREGEFDLDEGLRAQIIQREDQGLLTVTVNVHLADGGGGGQVGRP